MQYKECPRCHEDTLPTDEGRGALSRRDNKTMICSDCGMEEAFIDAGMKAVDSKEINFKKDIGV